MPLVWITGFSFVGYLEFIVCTFRQNVTLSTINLLWLKSIKLFGHYYCYFLSLFYFFVCFHFQSQAIIICLIVNVWLFTHWSELLKLSMKDIYRYIFQIHIKHLQFISFTGSSPCLESYIKIRIYLPSFLKAYLHLRSNFK